MSISMHERNLVGHRVGTDAIEGNRALPNLDSSTTIPHLDLKPFLLLYIAYMRSMRFMLGLFHTELAAHLHMGAQFLIVKFCFY